MRRHPYADVPHLPDGELRIETLADGPGPVEIDLGFGRAEFLLERARQRPDVRLIGVETRLKWVALARERAAARDLTNVRAYAGDARRLLVELAPDASVSAAYFHFPDPWWKKRHAKRRVLTEEAATHLSRLLRDGGSLFVQTDVLERAESILQVLESAAGLENLSGPGKLADANPVGIRSQRERRCEEEGLPVYRLSFRRRPR